MLSIAALLVVLLAPAVEQQSSNEPWKAESAFDVEARSLPVRFDGNTVPWVLRYGTPAPKSAMETDAEFDARRESFVRETFAFVLDEYRYSYDPASETVTVTVHPTLTSAGEVGSYATTFAVRRTKLPPTTRAAPDIRLELPQTTRAAPDRRSRPNRPNVADLGPAIATTRSWKQSQIVLADSATGFSSAYETRTFSVKMSADRARRAKPNLRVAFICVPAFEQYHPIGDPTMPEATSTDAVPNRPGVFSDQTFTYYFALRAELMQVWLFDRSTGEVYGRFTPSRTPALP